MEEDKDFTVSDRRSAEGQKEQEQPGSTQTSSGSAGTEPPRDAGEMPEVDFATFVLSLATSAQINLGAVPHPETNRTDRNMPAAKQMIDILGMLKEKTKGNLAKEEEALLDQVLFNLRMHYVRAAEEQKKSGGA